MAAASERSAEKKPTKTGNCAKRGSIDLKGLQLYLAQVRAIRAENSGCASFARPAWRPNNHSSAPSASCSMLLGTVASIRRPSKASQHACSGFEGGAATCVDSAPLTAAGTTPGAAAAPAWLSAAATQFQCAPRRRQQRAGSEGGWQCTRMLAVLRSCLMVSGRVATRMTSVDRAMDPHL